MPEAVLPPMDVSFRYDRTATALNFIVHIDPVHLTVSYQVGIRDSTLG